MAEKLADGSASEVDETERMSGISSHSKGNSSSRGSSSSSRKRTPRASKQELESLKNDFTSLNGKVDSLLGMFERFSSNYESRTVHNSDDDRISDIVTGAHDGSNNVTSGERSNRPVTQSVREDDEVSLQPGQREREVDNAHW